MTNTELLNIGKENFTRLKSLCEDNAKVIPFIGAGPSVTPGLPDWKDLLVNMIDEFEVLKSSDFEKLLNKYKYSEVASLIYSKINKDQYKEYLSKALKPKHAEFTSIHTGLVKRFKIILTTNFDNMLDEAAKEECLTVKKQILPNFTLSELFLAYTYVYLHGHIETGNLIFREEDYSLFYNDTNESGYVTDLYDLIKLFIKETHLVFIGFSFNDQDFSSMYSKIKNIELTRSRKEIHKHYGVKLDQQKEHFVFIGLDNEDMKNMKEYEKFKKLHILPIFYDVNQHVEVSRYIRELPLERVTVVKSEIGLEVLDV